MTEQKNTLVAVYGSLRSGQPNHRLLTQYETLSTERSVPEFTMISLGGFPGLIAGRSAVVLELYEVDSDTMQQLDWLEGYPDFYNRRIIDTSRGDAWVYFLADPDLHRYRNQEVVESGDWNEHHPRSSLSRENAI